MSSLLSAGTPAPDFTLPRGPGSTLRLADSRGHPVILAFYPADWSPVCGDELGVFNEVLPEFQRYGAELLGISVDGVWCHQAYAAARHLDFTLLADSSPRGPCRAPMAPTAPRTGFRSARSSCSMPPA